MLKDFKVIYVEDEVDISEEITYFLRPKVKELYVAHNGKEGLDLFKQTNANLIITDIQMPVMGGLEMIEAIRKLDETVPVVITSAYNDSNFLAKSITLNVDAYITKPLDLIKFHETLKKVIRPFELTKELQEKNQELSELLTLKTNQLQEERNLLETLFYESKDCIVLLDGNRVVMANHACATMFQFTDESQYINREIQDITFAPSMQPDGQKTVSVILNAFDTCLNEGTYRTEFLNQKQDGTLFWTDQVLTKLFYMGKTLIMIVVRNISAQKNLEEQLRLLATIDPLTGINNRRSFFALAQKLLQIDHEEDIYVLMIDIDNFKNINDTYGHEVGDNVLKAITRTIKATIKKDSIFGRLGGEEFSVVCHCKDEKTIFTRVEQLRKEIENLHVTNEHYSIKCTVSIGIAKRISKNDTLDHLLGIADTKLYEAKNSGKNRVRFR
jgi:diguanylate cyclase (GGDEF)-like protein/PAS domain S-box-containing protein